MNQAYEIEVIVCGGTTCHVMGASELMHLPEVLAQHGFDHVQVKAVPCLGSCKGGKHGEAPYVKINGIIVAGATVNKILDTLVAMQQEADHD